LVECLLCLCVCFSSRATRAIRELEQSSKVERPLYICATSGTGDIESLSEAKEVGFSNFQHKPLRMGVVSSELEKMGVVPRLVSPQKSQRPKSPPTAIQSKDPGLNPAGQEPCASDSTSKCLDGSVSSCSGPRC
jgi:hypothetical protein